MASVAEHDVVGAAAARAKGGGCVVEGAEHNSRTANFTSSTTDAGAVAVEVAEDSRVARAAVV